MGGQALFYKVFVESVSFGQFFRDYARLYYCSTRSFAQKQQRRFCALEFERLAKLAASRCTTSLALKPVG
jgi:hypothetical protein